MNKVFFFLFLIFFCLNAFIVMKKYVFTIEAVVFWDTVYHG